LFLSEMDCKYCKYLFLNTLYVHVKGTVCEETAYFKIVPSEVLPIQTGRYGRDRVERLARVCEVCEDHELEDEYHFVLNCKRYDNLRRKVDLYRYIKQYYRRRPSMFKLIELLKTINTTEADKFK